jgi:23S rRNA (uracil1939-C5)-methyltransferase
VKPSSEQPVAKDVTVDPSLDLCKHFGECGGCAHQDVDYEAQCAAKGQRLEALFEPYWPHAIPVTPSPVVWYYRNKLDFNFAPMRYPEPPPKDFQRELVLGFKRKGQWYWPLDMDECRISSPEMPPLLAAVRQWAKDHNLHPFDSRGRKGFLKFLLVREGKRTGDRMVVLVTRPGEIDKASFVDVVKGACATTSIQWAEDSSFGPAANADTVHVLDGDPTIDEQLSIEDESGRKDFRFRISPFSFFQTNTLATEVLYGRIREWVRALDPPTLYDLYGGAGGIAFTCSDLVDDIISVESVVSATEDGLYNAERNGISNVSFETAKVEKYLRRVQEEGGLAEGACIIMDPPRAGLHPKVIKRLGEMRPENVLYVSCKPTVLAQELETLGETYRITALEAVDLFPHTDHVEVLARLEARPGDSA